MISSYPPASRVSWPRIPRYPPRCVSLQKREYKHAQCGCGCTAIAAGIRSQRRAVTSCRCRCSRMAGVRGPCSVLLLPSYRLPRDKLRGGAVAVAPLPVPRGRQAWLTSMPIPITIMDMLLTPALDPGQESHKGRGPARVELRRLVNRSGSRRQLRCLPQARCLLPRPFPAGRQHPCYDRDVWCRRKAQ
jgi:hypothetical protein